MRYNFIGELKGLGFELTSLAAVMYERESNCGNYLVQYWVVDNLIGLQKNGIRCRPRIFNPTMEWVLTMTQEPERMILNSYYKEQEKKHLAAKEWKLYGFKKSENEMRSPIDSNGNNFSYFPTQGILMHFKSESYEKSYGIKRVSQVFEIIDKLKA